MTLNRTLVVLSLIVFLPIEAKAESSDQIVEEIVVYGKRIEKGQARAIEEQRNARSISTIISSELFGQVNDGNIANAMQRMPGLSADSNGADEIPRYVNIRGVSTAYNSVQVDGIRLPVTGTGRGAAYGNTGRGFALDDLPADAIEKIDIVKAPTPDMDGDGLGGSVNLVTKSALDYDGRQFQFRVGANHNELRDEAFGNGALTFIDNFELENERKLGISFTTSYYETNEGFDNRDKDYNPLVPDAALNAGLGLEELVARTGRISTALGSKDKPFFLGDAEDEPLAAVFYHEDTEYNNNVIDRERLGFAGNVDLQWNDRTRFYVKTLYNTEDTRVDDFRYHKIMDNDHGDNCGEAFDPLDPQSCFLSRLILPSDAPGPQVRLGAHPTRRSTIDYVDNNVGRASLDANGNPRGEVRYDGQTNDIELELWAFTAGGSFEFEESKLDVELSFSEASQDNFELDGDFRREGFAFEYDQTDPFRSVDADYRVINGDYSYLTNVDPFALVVDESRADTIQPSFYQSEHYDSTEERMQFKVDFEKALPELNGVTGTWKTGVKYSTMERDYDYTEVQFDLAEPGDAGYGLVPWESLIRQNPYEKVDSQPMPYVPDMEAIYAFVRDPANANNGSFTIDEDGSFEDSVEQDYGYEENILAMYLMATFNAGPIEVIAGARLEYTDVTVDRFVINEGNDGLQASDVTQVTDDRDYHNLLPGILVKWEVIDNLLIRFAATETFARPQLVDLINVRVVDEQDDPVEIEEGNFRLPPLESDNLDFVVEYYTDSGLWSIGYFRKDMTGFSFPAQVIIENAPEFGGRQLAITTPLATGRARNEGLELSVFERLDFLPTPFDGLFVNANYTYTESEAEYPNRESENLPTRGASRHLFFGSLGYETDRFTGEIQYRYRSPYIEGLAFVDAQGANNFTEDDLFGETGTWGFNLSYQVMDNIEVFLNGTNIFNEENASRQGYARYPEDVYYNERRIAIGLKGSF